MSWDRAEVSMLCPQGVNKDSYLILETLPTEYDSRVKAMEVDERPTEQYSDIGGLDKQIQELVEAIVLPMNHKEKFENLGIQPPKGVLMYGPPGTGKTLLARACAAQTKVSALGRMGGDGWELRLGWVGLNRRGLLLRLWPDSVTPHPRPPS